ncbi:terminase small subunit [Gibbsiella quercinecans]|uniref:terminase small subunit n=1 Tax=Gibbsiella quercinecans TaxID=929813 RepID=UPI00242CBB85|nr:terminase small subunit [Gibbsiella quercinecans]
MSKQPKVSYDHYAGNFKELYAKQYGEVISRTRQYTPEQVFNLAVRYFTWAEENAISAAETASFQGDVEQSEIYKPRVFTIKGLRLFCSFSEAVLIKWRRESGYSEVMEFIDSVIDEQKFQLAANGIINASFIGKDLGIDKPANITVENTAAASATATTEQMMAEAVESVLDKL